MLTSIKWNSSCWEESAWRPRYHLSSMKISEGANRLLWGLPTLGWNWSSVNWNPQHLAMQHRVYTFLNSCTVKHYTQVSLILWAYSALVLLPDYYYVYWSQNLLGVQMWQQLFSYALNSCTCYHVIYRTNSIPFQRLKYERMYAFFFFASHYIQYQKYCWLILR